MSEWNKTIQKMFVDEQEAQPAASVDAAQVWREARAAHEGGADTAEGKLLRAIFGEKEANQAAAAVIEAYGDARADAARREALEEAEWVPLSQDDAETELWLCLRDMFHPTDDKSLIAEMRKRSLWVYARADRTADEDEENPNAG